MIPFNNFFGIVYYGEVSYLFFYTDQKATERQTFYSDFIIIKHK